MVTAPSLILVKVRVKTHAQDGTGHSKWLKSPLKKIPVMVPHPCNGIRSGPQRGEGTAV